jgi:hypothetical protein
MNPQKVANCEVLGDGTGSNDSAHVKKQTPMQTKVKEIQDDPMYRTDISSGFNTKRQESTRNLRNSGDVRPLGGNK